VCGHHSGDNVCDNETGEKTGLVLTLRVVIWQVHQCVRRAWLAVRKARRWNGSNHLKTFIVLHVNGHVFKDLVIESVRAVKLTQHMRHAVTSHTITGPHMQWFCTVQWPRKTS